MLSLLERGIVPKPNPTSTTVLQCENTQSGHLQHAEQTLFGALAVVLVLRSNAGTGASLSAQVNTNRILIPNRQERETCKANSAAKYQAKPRRSKQYEKHSQPKCETRTSSAKEHMLHANKQTGSAATQHCYTPTSGSSASALSGQIRLPCCARKPVDSSTFEPHASP